MQRAMISHLLAGVAGATCVLLFGFASAPPTPAQDAAAPPAVAIPGDEVVRLLRSIDQKLDSRLVENPSTVGQAVHRLGFIAENLGKDMKSLLADLKRVSDDVHFMRNRVRGIAP